MNTIEKIGLIGTALGLVGIGYGIYIQRTFKEDLVNKVADGLTIDIPSDVVDRAINVAVEREVSKAVKKVSDQIVYNARNDIQREVRSTVDASFNGVKSSVSNEVAKQVANINMWELKRDVKEKAKEMIVEKFDENLDSLLSEFNDNLATVSKIYSSIADSMSNKQDSETILKIRI